MIDLHRSMVTGAAWMVLMKFCYRGIGVVSTIILARLLVPSDFGVVALAMLVISAFELMTTFGFDLALIQRQNAERSHYDTAWTFNVLFAVAAGLTVALMSGVAADFFDEARLESVLIILGVSFAFSGLENIGVVDFRKDLVFRKEFNFRLMQKIAMFSVTVPAAFLLRNYWALVAGMLVGNVLKVMLSYWYSSYRPKFCFSAAPDLFSFSKWVFLNKILFFLRKRSGDFIVGKVSGVGALGIFTLANEISQLAGTDLTTPINRAIFPAYAKMSGNIDTLRNGFLSVLRAVSLLALPAGFGLAAISELLVPVVLGSRWLATIPIIQVLAIAGALRALNLHSGSVFLALGRPQVATILAVTNVSVLLPTAVFLTLRMGAVGLAWAYLLSFCVVVPLSFSVTLRALKGNWSDVILAIWRPVVATTIMYVTVLAIVSVRPSADGSLAGLLALAGCVMVGATVYGLVVSVLWIISGRPVGTERAVLNWALKKIRAE